MSFRHFIDKADRAGYLVTIDRPVDTTFEIANVAHALEGRPVLFNHIAGYPGWRVCAGPCSDRAYFSLDMEVAAPDQLSHLEHAIAQDDAAQQQHLQEAQAAGKTQSPADGVTLRQRALPFIEMLQRCQKADKEVVWGV